MHLVFRIQQLLNKWQVTLISLSPFLFCFPLAVAVVKKKKNQYLAHFFFKKRYILSLHSHPASSPCHIGYQAVTTYSFWEKETLSSDPEMKRPTTGPDVHRRSL